MFLYSSDLCSAFGANVLGLVDVEPITELLTQGQRSKASQTKTLSQWATKEIRKLKNATSAW
jgi:importin subunit beta-1